MINSQNNLTAKPCNIRYCFAPCGNEYKPVCSKTGKTYDNLCKLQCGTCEELAYEGPCRRREECVCPAIY